MKYLTIISVLIFMSTGIFAQCNQHVFSSVGASQATQFQYQDCEGWSHFFTLPSAGYTVILCADIGTTFILSGDGFVYPLQTEHPSYASCLTPCLGDFDEDGTVDVNDLLMFLSYYGLCD